MSGFVETLRDMTAAHGVDYAFDTTGNTRVIEQCLAATRPGGTTVLVGLPPTHATITLSPATLVRQEKTITGSYYGSANPQRHFPQYAQWFLNGTLPLDRLISHTYRLDDINTAYQDMLSGHSLRGVIEMS